MTETSHIDIKTDINTEAHCAPPERFASLSGADDARGPAVSFELRAAIDSEPHPYCCRLVDEALRQFPAGVAPDPKYGFGTLCYAIAFRYPRQCGRQPQDLHATVEATLDAGGTVTGLRFMRTESGFMHTYIIGATGVSVLADRSENPAISASGRSAADIVSGLRRSWPRSLVKMRLRRRLDIVKDNNDRLAIYARALERYAQTPAAGSEGLINERLKADRIAAAQAWTDWANAHCRDVTIRDRPVLDGLIAEYLESQASAGCECARRRAHLATYATWRITGLMPIETEAVTAQKICTVKVLC